MPDEPQEIEERVDALFRQVAELRARVERLEGEPSSAATAPAQVTMEPPAASPQLAAGSSSRALAFLGRTLVVLGGAYLLRATSDAQVIPPAAGVAVGFAYAVWWLLACHRAGPRDRVSATFHGVASVLIGFPLLFESTARFDVTTVATGSTVLLVLGSAALGIAAHHRLVVLGWIVTALFLGTALALLVATRDVLPIMAILLLAAAGLEGYATAPPWRSLRWPTALCLDVVAVLLWSLMTRPDGPPPHYAPISAAASVALALALPILFLTSIAARTLAFRRAVTAFGVVQCTLALVIGLGGASGILAATGGPVTPISGVTLLLGVGCYAVSFAWLDRHSSRGRNFYFYATLALLLLLAGGTATLGGDALATAYLALALAASWAGRRLSRRTLMVHSTVYWCAGALAAGTLGTAFRGLFGSGAPWLRPPLAPLFAAGVGLICYAGMATRRLPQAPSALDLGHRLLLVALVVWGAAGTLATLLAAALVGAGEPDPGLLATLRTGVLAAGAVALAGARRRWQHRELGWLIYPVLLAGGLKLVVEDLKHGRPATLFLSLALFGGALLAVAKLSPPEGESQQPAA